MLTKKRGVLHLVRDCVEGKNIEIRDPRIQMELFSHNSKHTILVIYISDIDSKLFSNVLNNTHPTYIIDMRSNPRFDIVGYSRKMAFTEFENIGAKYMDNIELLGKGKKNIYQLVDAIEDQIIGKMSQGPLAFIFGKKELDESDEEVLINKLQKSKPKWSLAVVP